jgi:hypothetical protein
MYRDDGFGVLNGKWSYQEVVNWRNSFQDQVNKVAGGDCLQFTCEVWLDSTWRTSPNVSPEDMKKNKVTIRNGRTFPYLEIELIWSKESDLQFQVHLKPNNNSNI